ncbi:P-loop containing nucleoside triphosphate hydrolase protein, partial [Amanita muscaria]
FVPPYALQEILSALAINDSEARWRAFNWALVTLIINLSFAQVDLFQVWHSRRCYERTRGQLFCSLHFKSLKRRDISGEANSEEEKENADLGKIVNLMQGDAYAVAERFSEFSSVFTSPARLAIALTFLYSILGWSSFAGVAVAVVVYILNYPLAKYSIWLTRSSWKASDKRMSMVNELLQNIRFLKFYGWESRWAQRADDARETELQWRVKHNVLTVFLSFIWIWIPSAMALATFSCYTLIAKEKLTVSKAFTTIALLSQLQRPMIELPQQIFSLLHAYVSMQRIDKFLGEPEVPDWASTLATTVRSSNQDLIGFVHATFTWESTDDKMTNLPFRLGPLDLIFPRGQLTLISGPTGSGKSAMLAALLGEMGCMSGDVYLDKTRHQVAYCGQNPWLEHATIRDNIIYHSSRGFDAERYQDVIEACALNKDLEVFDAGDMTEIGERGVTLSGGQRARVALARALYSEAKCILLDDPLAAVNMHTAQHIVNECLKGKLAAGRTILLVTHHLNLCLPIASHFVELEKGHVIRQGPAKEFMDDLMGKTESLTVECNSGKATLDDEPDGLGKPTNLIKKIGDGKLIEKEARHEGQISWRAYYTYIRAAGLYCWVLTLTLLILVRVINVLNQIYLAKWGEAYERDLPQVFSIDYPWTGFPSPDKDVRPWITFYLYISLSGALLVFLRSILRMYASLQASRTLFKALLRRLSRAPVRFFDITPIGRILNRFTTDMITIDWALVGSVSTCLSGILRMLASFSVILSLVPSFIPCAFIIAWSYIRLAPSYVRASRDLRRLELVSLSPAFAGFDELLHGITHVRAFGMEQRYQNGFFAKWLVNGWLRLGSVIVFAATLFALWSGISDGFAAIVIVQAGVFADANRQLVKVAAQLELDFNSVERVVEYLDVAQEASAIVEKSRPPAYWPSDSGRLEVENLTIHYAPHLPPALRDLSFSVRPSEKVGVVGRTGSGKSTLALSLLRMVEPTSGRIILDNIDISTISLEDLRRRVTIISQDVSLFSGTIGTNLDPLGEHSTEERLNAVKRCHLASVIQHTTAGDETSILDKTVNHDSLSAGEKQLVALARAMLRKSNVVIMDEATSQIDIKLDGQIQDMIREELSNAIVITIAHRLKTIINYDRVLVLDGGQIIEFDEPKVLLRREGGVFREMCLKSVDWPIFSQMLSE